MTKTVKTAKKPASLKQKNMKQKTKPNREPESLIAYKGFDRDLEDDGVKYEVSKEYQSNDTRFKALFSPIEVISYCSPAFSRFCIVEQSGKFSKSIYDDFHTNPETESRSTKIKLHREVSLYDFIQTIHVFSEPVKPDAGTGVLDCDRFKASDPRLPERTPPVYEMDYFGDLRKQPVNLQPECQHNVSATQDRHTCVGTRHPHCAAVARTAGSMAYTKGIANVSMATCHSSIAYAGSCHSVAVTTGVESVAMTAETASVAVGLSLGRIVALEDTSAAIGAAKSLIESYGNYSVAGSLANFSTVIAKGCSSVAFTMGSFCTVECEKERSIAVATDHKWNTVSAGKGGAAIIFRDASHRIFSTNCVKAKEGGVVIIIGLDDGGNVVDVQYKLAGKDIEPDTFYRLNPSDELIRVSANGLKEYYPEKIVMPDAVTIKNKEESEETV
jgi:hypothetical protein